MQKIEQKSNVVTIQYVKMASTLLHSKHLHAGTDIFKIIHGVERIEH